jgi:hypothetical protein
VPWLQEREQNGGAGASTLLRALGLPRAGSGDMEGEDPARPQEPRAIGEAFEETYPPALLRFCNVVETWHMAPVWHRLVNCHKSEQHTVLTQELQKVCMLRGAVHGALHANHHHDPPAANSCGISVCRFWSR